MINVSPDAVQVPLYHKVLPAHGTPLMEHPCDICGVKLFPLRHLRLSAPLSLGAHQLRLSATSVCHVSDDIRHADLLICHIRPYTVQSGAHQLDALIYRLYTIYGFVINTNMH